MTGEADELVSRIDHVMKGDRGAMKSTTPETPGLKGETAVVGNQRFS